MKKRFSEEQIMGFLKEHCEQARLQTSYISLEEAVPTAKQVISSRSFGERVESLPELRAAVVLVSYFSPIVLEI